MNTKNPPPYQQDVLVYNPQPAQPVMTMQYAVQPVPQKNPNEFRNLFNAGHIARKSELTLSYLIFHSVMTLNAIFCSLIIVFMSDCLSY